MTAYSFKAQFVQPILDGTKTGTIRGIGKKRHARPGEKVQLYIGMRTKHCQRIAEFDCVRTNEIELDLTRVCVPWLPTGGLVSNGVPIDGKSARDEFARADGFKDFEALIDFWLLNHGAIHFRGVHIIWRHEPQALNGSLPGHPAKGPRPNRSSS